jgi:hypothetical protein
LKKRVFQTHASAADAGETRLLVRRGRIEIKVEVNFVMRDTVQPVRRASLALTPTVRDVQMADWTSRRPWTATGARHSPFQFDSA